MSRRGVLTATAAVAAMSAVVLVGASISVTEAQRSSSQHAQTEFSVTVAPTLVLEGSADGLAWNGSGVGTTLTFTPDQMALRVGMEDAVYAPMYVRAGAGSNTAAVARVAETGLGDSDFATALRGEIYRDAPTCDAVGVATAINLSGDAMLRGQRSDDFGIAAPGATGEPGPATQLCVRVWLNDNNWLLGGTTPPTESATWTVTGTSL